jgi:hypothetical protein
VARSCTTMMRPSRYRRRRLRLLLAAVGILVLVALPVAALYVIVLPLVRPERSPVSRPPVSSNASPTRPACPTGELPHAARLGEVAWINAGALRVIDLGTCRQLVLVNSGAALPVRFSPDGDWLVFGQGNVMPAAGGGVSEPFGTAVRSWEWSPVANVLAGVTQDGGVLIARPGGGPEALLRDGSGAHHLAFAPDGRSLEIDRVGQGIQVLDVATARARTIFHEPDPAKVPEVAGWSADGRWVLYWRGPVGTEGGPLDAVPFSGGPWVNLFEPMLAYRDSLSFCGSRIALSVGAGLAVSEGKQIVLTGPPIWAFHNLTDDYTRSWIWPACSPDGRWLAVTDTFNHQESADNTIDRGLWLLSTDGSSRRLLVPGTRGAPEFPRWSSNGSVILVVVRSGSRWSSSGSLVLVQVNPRSGRMVKRLGPIAHLGSAPGPGGHQQWAAISDWYRP